jgi:hypothetical protein
MESLTDYQHPTLPHSDYPSEHTTTTNLTNINLSPTPQDELAHIGQIAKIEACKITFKKMAINCKKNHQIHIKQRIQNNAC